jgi:hypothetical protein
VQVTDVQYRDMKWLAPFLLLSSLGLAAQDKPQAAAKTAPRSNSDRFQLVGHEVSVLCSVMCRLDTETGRVWYLQKGRRANAEGPEGEEFFFWKFIPEDTNDTFASPYRQRSLPLAQ